MKSNMFLAALPNQQDRGFLMDQIHACEAVRPRATHIRWTHARDLHITLGFIASVEECDLPLISQAMEHISQHAAFTVQAQRIQLFGNAIVASLGPCPFLYSLHQNMHQYLIAATAGRYQFDIRKHFSPHLTLGRIINVAQLRSLDRKKIVNLINNEFQIFPFLISQAGLLRRRSLSTPPVYQTLQVYELIGPNKLM